MEAVAATEPKRPNPSLERSKQFGWRNYVPYTKLGRNLQKIKAIAFKVQKIDLDPSQVVCSFIFGNLKS